MTKSITQFKAAANLKHNDFYNYSLWNPPIQSKTKVPIICPTHGKFDQILNSHLQGRGCKKCAQIIKEKAWLEKYGVTNPAKNSLIKKKTADTNNKRYGSHPSKLDTTKVLIKQTKEDRYGDANFNNMLQGRQTKHKRYGNVNYNNRSENCISSIKNTKKGRYGNSKYNNVAAIKATNLSKYGSTHSSQRNMLAALPYLESSLWLITEHHIHKKTLSEIAETLNVNTTTICNYLRIHDIETKLFSRSSAERELGDFIESLDIDIVTSNRSIISPLELDIYIPSHNLAIEYCGLYWHADRHTRIDNQYHKRKHDLCRDKGIQLLTIFEDEWRDRQNQVKRKVESLLGVDNSKTIFARKCTINEIDYHTKKSFFNAHHIQGDGPGSIHIGLTHNECLIAVMSFFKQKDSYYLNRYATSCRVPGGFSKLLKHFQTTNDWNTLISFADQRWSNGNLYDKTGWILDSTIPPDYCYSADGLTRTHKFNYRKKNLDKLLTTYDSSLSERVNCDNNGILRIWDCGKLRYIMHKS